MTPAEHAATVREALDGDGSTDAAIAALDALVAQAERPHALVLSDLYDERDAAEAERDRMKEERDNWHASNFGERQARQAAEAERDELRARLTEWETSVATEALKAEREAAVQAAENWKTQAEIAIRAAEHAREALRRGIDIASQYLDTGRGDLDGWIESARAALTEDEGCEYHRPLFVKGCRDCAALTKDST